MASNDLPTIALDPRFEALVKPVADKPNIFNSLKIAKQLMKEREQINSLLEDYRLLDLSQISAMILELESYRKELNDSLVASKAEIEGLNGQVDENTNAAKPKRAAL